MNVDVADALMNQLLQLAEVFTKEIVAASREDDPHRFATLSQEFEGGRAVPSLVIEHAGGTKRRIAVRFTGQVGGEEKVVEVGALIADIPPAPTVN